MRMIISVQLKNPVLPREYRPLVPKLLQAGFNTLGQFNKHTYFTTEEQPYCFSVYLPKAKFGKQIQLESNLIKIIFSTNRQDVLDDFYNAAQALEEPVEFMENMYTITCIKQLSGKNISDSEAQIRMLGPLLIWDTPEKGGRMLGIRDHAFQQRLQEVVENMLGVLGEDPALASTLSVTSVNPGIKPKEVHVLHSGRFYRGTVGELQISGDVEMLNIAYAYGIGMLREQGFGLFEWVR